MGISRKLVALGDLRLRIQSMFELSSEVGDEEIYWNFIFDLTDRLKICSGEIAFAILNRIVPGVTASDIRSSIRIARSPDDENELTIFDTKKPLDLKQKAARYHIDILVTDTDLLGGVLSFVVAISECVKLRKDILVCCEFLVKEPTSFNLEDASTGEKFRNKKVLSQLTFLFSQVYLETHDEIELQTQHFGDPVPSMKKRRKSDLLDIFLTSCPASPYTLMLLHPGNEFVRILHSDKVVKSMYTGFILDEMNAQGLDVLPVEQSKYLRSIGIDIHEALRCPRNFLSWSFDQINDNHITVSLRDWMVKMGQKNGWRIPEYLV